MTELLNILFNPAIFGIAALFLAILWMLADQKDKTRALLVIALVVNLFYGFLLTTFMGRENSLFPLKYDYVLFHLDSSLGRWATDAASHLQGPFYFPLWLFYQLMVPMMIAWFLVVKHGQGRGSIVVAYIAEMVTGPVLYAILPACGPIYAFGKEWLHPPSVPAEAFRLAALPNAFPSLHVGTAFVMLLFAPSRWSRAISLAFLGLTAMATLATGEHYVIDLIPGLVFGAYAAACGIRAWRRIVFFGAIVLSWTLSVRFGYVFLIAHSAIIKLCAILSVAVAAWALWKQWREPSEESALPSRVATAHS